MTCRTTMAPPPVYASKYSSSRGVDKHALYMNTTSEAQQPTAKPVQSAKLYPTSVDMPKLPPSLIDEPLITDVPKEVSLGPQQVEVGDFYFVVWYTEGLCRF